MKNVVNKYYKELDVIRILACIAIFLYHLNILKGGYLAVCVFFVLSGYLSFKSVFNKERFSLKEYYKNRIIKIYIPLLVVVFLSITVISFMPSIEYFNLKPETTSVILGYNNYWQISANLDYFARHLTSPFMHFWYISILMQFDLIFPFIYLGLQKLKNKYNPETPCMTVGELSIIATLYFFIMSLGSKTMVTYYSTLTRVFSLLFGVFLALIHSYYSSLIIKKVNKPKTLFYVFISILTILFIFVDAKSNLFSLGIILTTIITCLLIDMAIKIKDEKESKIAGLIRYLSNITYEIYLVQYPIIFIFQYLNISSYLKIPLIIILVFIISILIHHVLNFNKKSHKVLNLLLSVPIIILTLVGVYHYIITPDYTKEMQALEEELVKNQEIMSQKQKEYDSKLLEEENSWLEKIKNTNKSEEEIRAVVSNLSIVGIGDSVMLGAIDNLYKTFPKGYIDAEVSRTAWKANAILKELKDNNKLANTIIFNLGVNGDCSKSCKLEILETCGNRDIYWVNVANGKQEQTNRNLEKFANEHSNVHIIDWAGASNGHPEYFVADGVHLTNTGRKAYAETIYNAIYQKYLNEYKQKLENTINEHKESKKNKITFYGNDLLIYAFDNLEKDFEYSIFNLDTKYNFNKIKSKIEESLANNTLTNKVVLAFDNNTKLSIEEYQEIIRLCDNRKIYILSLDKETTNALSNIQNDNLIIIDFYKELNDNNEYISLDKIHLTSEGNKALSKILKDQVK